MIQVAGEAGHDAQAVVPQRVDLYRLANPRRHHPIADFGIHPGKLHTRFTRVEQAIVGVQVDVVAGATLMPLDNVLQDREKVTQ